MRRFRVIATLDDPKTAAVLAAATGMSIDGAQAMLGTLRARVEAVKDAPARVTAEVRDFLAQYTERAKQQVLAAAAKTPRAATIGSWITFSVMVVTLGVSIVGAMGGIPSLAPLENAWALEHTCDRSPRLGQHADRGGRLGAAPSAHSAVRAAAFLHGPRPPPRHVHPERREVRMPAPVRAVPLFQELESLVRCWVSMLEAWNREGGFL